MRPVFTKKQMMGPPMSPHEFAAWYVAEIMVTEFPHFIRDLGKKACEAQTRNGLYYAEHFGITRPDLQGQFMTIMWAVGPNFFETKAFGDILNAPHLDEDAKIDALYGVPAAAGGRAVENANDLYWFPWLIENNILGLEDDPEWDDDDLAPDEEGDH